MYDPYENIYRLYRERAGISREKAAELLDVSVSSLTNYERFMYGANQFKCPDEVVVRMAKAYGNRELIWRHISENTLAGREIIPKMEDVPLSNAFLKLMIEQDDVEALEKELAKISSDDIVHPDEVPTFMLAVQEIWGMVQAGISFIFAGDLNIKEKAPVGADANGLKIR